MKVTNKRAVLIALVCNIIIFGIKAMTAWFSDSGALYSETLHSLADVINSILLLVGIRRAAKLPDRQHPLGYTRALYFWSLIGAIFMFGVIASGSMAIGFERVKNPSPIQNIYLALGGLAISLVLEMIAVYFALHALGGSSGANGRKGVMSAFRTSRDPTVRQVFVEDCLSLSGVVIAFVGVGLVHFLGINQIDGYAAIIIGAILAILALYLINDNRKKIIGEAAGTEIDDAVRKNALANPEVRDVVGLRIVQIGANKVVAYMTVVLDPNLMVERVDDITYDIEKRIIRTVPEVDDCYIEVVALNFSPSVPPADK